MRKNRQPLIWMLLCALIFSLVTATSSRVHAQDSTIDVNGQDSGRIFDGVGALSGGGGTSRLLIDYPPKQRKQILDYLFKPNYGASLQILKVEIGSDTDSTEGAEASSQRTPTDHNYNRGYEWWLMEQAKLRNPHIKLYGLEWGAPGWFHGGFWSQDNIHYIINWIKHAQSDHHLHIDYIGGWNEREYDKNWYEDLKSALKSNGLHTQIVGSDSSFRIASDMRNDPALNQAVDIVGVHYPCGYLGNVYPTCGSDTDAQALNKPIWQSEAGSAHYDYGASALAQAITHGYLDDKITATINWTVVDAWYDTLPYAGDGLMQANQPWSGYYYVAKSIWVTAHMTQFTKIGWQFLDGASGNLAGDRSNGTYLSLKSPKGKDYSIYIETASANAPLTVTFQVSHGLSTGTVHVWTTDLSSSKISDWFVQQKRITPHNGTFSLTLQPHHIYSLTTTSGQSKGTATSPAQASLKLPYRDNFKHYRTGQIPRYFSTLNGAYETAPCASPHKRMCLRQVISIPPITWMNGPDPLTVVGDPNWTNYQVSMDALMEQAGYIDLIGGIKNQNSNHVDGYHLHFTNDGSWQLFKEADDGTQTVLASGITSFGLNAWHHLTLKMKAGTVEALIDNKSLATVNDSTFLVGQVGIQVASWINAQFDNFAVTLLS